MKDSRADNADGANYADKVGTADSSEELGHHHDDSASEVVGKETVEQNIVVPPTSGAIPPTQEMSFLPPATSTSSNPEFIVPAVKQSSKSSKAKTAVIPLIVSALIGGGVATGGNILYESKTGKAITSSSDSSPNQVIVNDNSKVNSTTAVAQKAMPSVVTIGVVGQSGSGSGSGVVIDNQGHILTNNHVVTGEGTISNPTIQVKDNNGKVYSGKVVGTDALSDLAVIKIEGSNLTPIEFGDSSKLNVGQTAVAIGAPLGLSESVTDGIVSALNRTLTVQTSSSDGTDSTSEGQQNQQNQENSPFKFALPEGSTSNANSTSYNYLNVIQTDAAINPGNSGGALLDNDGKLIGINVAIASVSGSASGNIGVGFAIPSDYAQRIAKDIINGGKAQHGYLGINIESQAAGTDASKASFSTGAKVVKVEDNSPASKAGLKAGDVITHFGNKSVSEAGDLIAQARESVPNTQVEVTFLRDNKEQKATMTVGESK